ncbi:MAG: hypothetical protein DMF61_03885 [Blastocatellia bacterium AA13]|nr:MAG: hypothetical protein DMF61_03885 [Blastocatellia bacterium AA13]
MTSICAWCQSILGDTSEESGKSRLGKPSLGICNECEAKRQQNILDIKRQLGWSAAMANLY